jgi:hypothetical protein
MCLVTRLGWVQKRIIDPESLRKLSDELSSEF